MENLICWAVYWTLRLHDTVGYLVVFHATAREFNLDCDKKSYNSGAWLHHNLQNLIKSN